MNRPPLDLGPLPVLAIKAAIGLDLAPGLVHFSTRAQAHAESRHPGELDLCLRYAGQVVATPDYIGQGPGQADGFELIGEAVQEGALILVAIKVRPDKQGRYFVASTYPIARATLDRRLRKGFLVRA